MILLLALTLAATPPAAKVNKETFPSAGVTRTVYTFVPDQVVGKPAPVIITLHGSGRDGRILVDNWKSLAEKEGIILAGLDATVRDGWHLATDGPNLLRDLWRSSCHQSVPASAPCRFLHRSSLRCPCRKRRRLHLPH